MLRIDSETRAMWKARERKERIKSALNCIGAFFATVLFALLAWAFLAITPSQRSAEADAVAEEMQR